MLSVRLGGILSFQPPLFFFTRNLEGQREKKLIGRKPVNLIVGWCGRFFFFVVPTQFSQVVIYFHNIGEWPENQILIPNWTYFHCPWQQPNKLPGSTL